MGKLRDYFFFNREVKGSKEKVISDKDLELLLDRSDLIGKSFHVFFILFSSKFIFCKSSLYVESCRSFFSQQLCCPLTKDPLVPLLTFSICFAGEEITELRKKYSRKPHSGMLCPEHTVNDRHRLGGVLQSSFQGEL